MSDSLIQLVPLITLAMIQSLIGWMAARFDRRTGKAFCGYILGIYSTIAVGRSAFFFSQGGGIENWGQSLLLAIMALLALLVYVVVRRKPTVRV